MNIKEIMTSTPACCLPDTTLEQVARMMVQNNCGAIPIVDNLDSLEPVGIVTDRDIACRSFALGKDPLHVTAGEVMTTSPLTMHPDDSVEMCCEVMEKNAVRRMLIVDDAGRCVGIVAQADIARSAPTSETGALVRDISIQLYAASGVL